MFLYYLFAEHNVMITCDNTDMYYYNLPKLNKNKSNVPRPQMAKEDIKKLVPLKDFLVTQAERARFIIYHS